MVEKQIKTIKDQRLNSQKEGQICCTPIDQKGRLSSFEMMKSRSRQTESVPQISSNPSGMPSFNFNKNAMAVTNETNNRNTQNLMPNSLISKTSRERIISNGAISIGTDSREREMIVNDLEIQRSKLLIKHLMKMYHRNNLFKNKCFLKKI